jgi:hypothetical protein
VTPFADWQQVFPGDAETCALRELGQFWCWGELNGLAAVTTTPVRIGTGTWQSYDGGSGWGCAIATGGSRWCWGFNSDGQYGDGMSWATPWIVE